MIQYVFDPFMHELQDLLLMLDDAANVLCVGFYILEEENKSQ